MDESKLSFLMHVFILKCSPFCVRDYIKIFFMRHAFSLIKLNCAMGEQSLFTPKPPA